MTIPGYISLTTLRSAYHAVILSSGTSGSRRLSIPGENLRGVVSAQEFVGFYNGHPDQHLTTFDFKKSETAVIIGMGNVSLDIARMLLKAPSALESTDITSRAIDVLRESGIKNVNIYGRRGPAQVAFTTKELREIFSLQNLNIHIDADILSKAFETHQESIANDRPLKRLFDLFHASLKKPKNPSFHNLHFKFFSIPLKIVTRSDQPINHTTSIPSERLCISFEKNVNVESQSIIHSQTDNTSIECDIIFKSIGYTSTAPPTIQFDHRKNQIRNNQGRILDVAGEPLVGMYVSGWLKTGPKGVIAETMYSAQSTSESIIKDIQEKRLVIEYKDGIIEMKKKGWGRTVTEQEWANIDRIEKDAGLANKKVREKVSDWKELLRISRLYPQTESEDILDDDR